MIAVLHPSFWQQTLAGLVVIFLVLPAGALGLLWVTRAVLEPHAAGRQWPEGARRVRLLVEVIVDIQRVPVGDADHTLDVRQGLRFGLAVAACSVVPLSSGLVAAQPALGLYLLPLVLALDAVIGDRWSVTRASDAVVARIGLAAVLGLGAGVVAAQWGTGSLSGVVTAQAGSAIFGVAGWGLATAWVQPLAFVVVVMALHQIGVATADGSVANRGGPLGIVAAVTDQALFVAGAAWLVSAFLGGGAVPWTIANAGARHGVSVIVFLAKLGVVTLALAWARTTWPTMSRLALRRLLVAGAIITTVSIGATVGIRHLI